MCTATNEKSLLKERKRLRVEPPENKWEEKTFYFDLVLGDLDHANIIFDLDLDLRP